MTKNLGSTQIGGVLQAGVPPASPYLGERHDLGPYTGVAHPLRAFLPHESGLTQNLLENPITVLGMHRSGTTLIANLLTACNVWMGYNFNANHESLFFVNINKRLFRQQGEYWHRCDKTLTSVEDDVVLEKWRKEVSRFIKSRMWLWHFGILWFGYALRSRVLQQKIVWGWKDPRTTLLFPLWKRIFPCVRVIAVIRNPRDVCISLYYRELRRYEAKIKSGRTDLVFEFPLSRSFDIWKLYTQRVLQTVEKFPDSAIVLRYEELNNEEPLRHLCSFVGACCNLDDLASLVSYHKSRYEDPPGLDQLEEILAADPLVSELGY